MRRMSTIAIGGACAALLGACTSTLDQARTMKPAGDAFAQALHKGYVDMAQRELDQTDLDDAHEFALRARSAGLGNPEPVEALEARKIPAEHRAELVKARGRLVKALEAGTRKTDPQRAATAQLMYECWTQEQEENIQPDDIAACRTGFEKAMAGLEVALAKTPKKAASLVKPMTADKPVTTIKAMPIAAKSTATEAPMEPKLIEASAKTVAAPPARSKYTVLFDFDAVDVKQAARSVLAQAITSARVLGATVIKVTGHADRAGSAAYNDQLSKRRAEAVAAVMNEIGPDKRRIETSGVGERMPAVKTPDGVREPGNRRVEIELIH